MSRLSLLLVCLVVLVAVVSASSNPLNRIVAAASSSAEPIHSSTAEPVHSSTAEPVHSSTAEPVHSSTAGPVHSSTAAPVHSSTAGPSSTAPAPVPIPPNASSTAPSPIPSPDSSSSSGPAEPTVATEPIFIGDYTLCKVYAIHSNCQTFLSALVTGEPNCINIAIHTGVNASVSIPNVMVDGVLNWGETQYETMDCTGTGKQIATGHVIIPTVIGAWNNVTYPVMTFHNAAGGALLPGGGNSTLTWTARVGLIVAPVVPIEDDTRPDVHAVLAVVLCAAIILVALLFGASMGGQSTKKAPAGTLGGEIVAAGHYGKF